MSKLNWINGFDAGNKKEKYSITIRIGTFTLLEIKYCPCDKTTCKCSKFRFMICNLGLEL